ncbi:MAG: hypothetical protein J5589_01730 [Firmicutes bacterium]|nr:hypothetical protein [Bacillota bacterium]
MDHQEKDLTRNTTVFVCLFLLAGILHIFEGITDSFFAASFLFSVITMIYLGLVMFWTISVRYRLLPTQARIYTFVAAGCMLVLILIRTVKYRYNSSDILDRWLWYLGYIPILVIPGMFAMTAVETLGSRRRKIQQILLIIILISLMLLVLTNDLTYFVWKPAGQVLASRSDSYTYGFGFYVIYGGMIVLYLYGLLITFRYALTTRSWRTIASLVILPLLYAFLQLSPPYLKQAGIPVLYQTYEVHVFGMMAIWENCIRLRLFPYNSRYDLFLEKMSLPTLITDQNFVPCYQAAWQYSISREQLIRSLDQPVFPTPDIRLMGRKIQAGYAFWIEDVREVGRLRSQLEEIHETLATENDLIQAEQRLREKQDRIELRNRIYGIVAEELVPDQRKIREQLENLEADDPDLRKKIAYLAVDHAFVKRKTNLTLLATQESEIELRELELALEESARYLQYLGIEATVDCRESVPGQSPENASDGMINSFMALRLYDTFSMALDILRDRITQLVIAVSPVGIRMSCDLDEMISIPEARVPVDIKLEEGILFVRLIGEVMR